MSDLNFFSGATNKSDSASYTPEQATWMKNLLATYGQKVGQGQESYGGTRVAPLTGTQQDVLSGLDQYSGALQGTTNTPMYAQTGAALSDILSGEMGAEPYSEQDVNALFQSAYATPARQQWERWTKPEVQESYSGPGYWGTSRMKAVQQGAEDVGNTLASQYGKLRWDTESANKALEEAKAGRALSAIPLAGEYNAEPLTQALQGIQGRGALYNLASAGQQQNQAEIEAEMEKWLESQQITDPQALSTMMDLLGMGYQSSKSRGTSDQMGMRWFGGATQQPNLPSMK